MAIKIEDFKKPLDGELIDYLKRFATTEEMFKVATEKGLRKSSLHTLVYRNANLEPIHASALTALIGKANKRVEQNNTEYEKIKVKFQSYL